MNGFCIVVYPGRRGRTLKNRPLNFNWHGKSSEGEIGQVCTSMCNPQREKRNGEGGLLIIRVCIRFNWNGGE